MLTFNDLNVTLKVTFKKLINNFIIKSLKCQCKCKFFNFKTSFFTILHMRF